MNLSASSIRPDDSDELAALCKAGGDPLRLNVLRALTNDSFGVLELAQYIQAQRITAGLARG